MKILLPKSNLLVELFPQIKNYSELSNQDLGNIKQAYSYGSYQPEIEETDDFIVITIDHDVLSKERKKFEEVVSHCENGDLNKGLIGINELIDNNPLISDYHRLKGQILSEQGHKKQAINKLIEALRLDPKNTSALIMLGNIYSSEKGDIDTALNFYERVLELNPDDHLALNNIGGNLAKAGKLDEAERYFDLAYELNPNYPNTIYGQALLASRKDNFKESFAKSIEAFDHLEINKDKALFKQNLELAQESAVEYIKKADSKSIVESYKTDLEEQSGKAIKLKSDDSISNTAKLEIAEVYGRDHHLVKFKTNRIAVEHLIMHELGHLELIIDARKDDSNKLFTTDEECRNAFNEDNRSHIVNSLQKQGVPKGRIDGFVDNIFQGLNSQIYNTPLDLFIEQRLYSKFADFKPFQFMSLLKLEEDYIASAVNKDIKKLVPKKIHQTNKILSLVNTLQFKELYNLDLTDQFNPNKKELKKAEKLYQEWLTYTNEKEPAIEYNLVEKWAESFEVDSYFKLVDESSYSNRQDDKNIIDQIERDPLALEDQESIGKESFSNEDQVAGQMATVMYIVDALEYFEGKSIDEIRKIGFEIGMLGRSGIDTDTPEKKYSLNSIPGKKFSGRHLLAYMYTAFQEFEPDLDTGIDFKKEYEQALELFKGGN